MEIFSLSSQEKQVEVPSHLEEAEMIWTEFDLLQNKIEDLNKSEKQMQYRISFDNQYHELIAKPRRIDLKDQPSHSQLSAGVPVTVQPWAANGQTVAQAHVKLPSIDLLKFNDNYEH